MNRFPAWRNLLLGSVNVYKFGLKAPINMTIGNSAIVEASYICQFSAQEIRGMFSVFSEVDCSDLVHGFLKIKGARGIMFMQIDRSTLCSVGILDNRLASNRNRVGIGLSYRPARLHKIRFLGIDSLAPEKFKSTVSVHFSVR
jgi:hypothetical protein